MNKQEFLDALKMQLAGIPAKDVKERLDFYSEMIDDRIEEGLTEQDAISQIGSVKEIAAQIIADIPFVDIAKKKIKHKRRLSVFEIVLLALGSPIWISLAIAAFAVIFSLYVSLWAVIISLWAGFVSLVCSAIGSVIAGIVIIVEQNLLSGIAVIGAGFVCSGISILFFLGCKAATDGVLLLTKKIPLCIKKCFVKKEDA